MVEGKQSKALMKLGVATDLGTAVRTSSNKEFLSPETRRTRKTDSDRLLKAFIQLHPNKNLDAKQLDRMLAQKIQQDIESHATAKKKSPIRVLASREVGFLSPGDKARNLGVAVAPATAASSRPETTATSRTATARSGTGATERDPTASTTLQGTAGTAPATSSAVDTAGRSSEIDIVMSEEAESGCAQAKPMVLNLEEPLESTIEVLEYEAMRPVDVPGAEGNAAQP